MTVQVLKQIGPECFSDGTETVISYKGANFYKACEHFVSNLPEGGTSSCVKRVNHPGFIHEDFYGKTLNENLYETLSDKIYSEFPWEGDTYEAVAEKVAAILINEGWCK